MLTSNEPLGTPASVAGPATGATSGVKEEDHNPESDNIPEIHFPSSESGDGSGAGKIVHTISLIYFVSFHRMFFRMSAKISGLKSVCHIFFIY